MDIDVKRFRICRAQNYKILGGIDYERKDSVSQIRCGQETRRFR